MRERILSVGGVHSQTDTVDYSVATNTVTLVIQPALLTVTANNASRNFGQANPVFTGTVVGVTNGDNITATYASDGHQQQPGGTIPHHPDRLVDPGHRLTNYSVTPSTTAR